MQVIILRSYFDRNILVNMILHKLNFCSVTVSELRVITKCLFL